jgi:hypothetical protein
VPGCHGAGVAPGVAGLRRIHLDTSVTTGFNLAGQELPITGRGACTGIISGAAHGPVLQIVASASFTDSGGGAVLQPDAAGTISSSCSEVVGAASAAQPQQPCPARSGALRGWDTSQAPCRRVVGAQKFGLAASQRRHQALVASVPVALLEVMEVACGDFPPF